MAKRTKSKPLERGYVLFDILYEDKSRASNRRVPMAELSGLDPNETARRIARSKTRPLRRSLADRACRSKR
jgi:hypothetical protein